MRKHLTIAACAALAIAASVSAAERKSARRAKESASAAAVEASAPSVPVGTNLLSPFWQNPEFVKSFMGAYGFASEIEPKVSPEEQAFLATLQPMLQDDPAKAAREIQSKLKPESSALFDFLLASIHLQMEETQKALTQFEAAVAKFPSFRRAHKNLGFALVQVGEHEKAVTHLTRTIELGGADSGVFGLLGFSYMNLGRHISAEAAYKNALLYAPDNLDWKLGLIKSQIATGHLQPAADLLDELLAKHPEKESLWILQAGLYLQMEQPMKAALNYEVVRKLGKAGAKELALLGDIYMSRDARELALPAYLEAVKLDPQGSPSRIFRAVEVLASRGGLAEASQLLRQVRETQFASLSEEDSSKLLKLEARVALAGGEPEKGAAVLEQLIARNPLDGEALLMLGEHYSRGGETEKADYRFELASKISGFEAEALVKRAQLLVQGRKYAQAIEFLRRAQKINPRDHIQRYLEKVEGVARTAGS